MICVCHVITEFCVHVIVPIVTVWLFLNFCFLLKCMFSGRRLQVQWVEDTGTTCKISSWCGTTISKFHRSMSQLHTCTRYKMLHLLSSAWAWSCMLWHDLSLRSHSSLTDWTWWHMISGFHCIVNEIFALFIGSQSLAFWVIPKANN